MTNESLPPLRQMTLKVPVGDTVLDADLNLPRAPRGLVLFAHGSGSSRLSPRNRHVAEILNAADLATLLTDLLSPDEDRIRDNRFDIALLARRMTQLVDVCPQLPECGELPIGLFGASTGAAAALRAAAERPRRVMAVVSRGGRPDLTGERLLPRVAAPTLLIVGSEDHLVIELNHQALERLDCVKALRLVSGATHLFEEPGTLDEAAGLARDWFLRHLHQHDVRAAS